MTDDNVQSEPNADDATNADDVSSPAAEESSPPQPMAASSPPAKKPRSSTERLIVWGLIGVLLLFSVVEVHAKYAYKWTIASLKNAIEKDVTGETISVAQLDGLLKGFATKSVVKKEGTDYSINCKWYSLLRPLLRRGDYIITIHVSSDQPDALVLSYSTPDAEPEFVRKNIPVGNEGNEAQVMGGGSAGVPGGAGRGRGGRRPRGMMGQLVDEDVQAELKLTDEQKEKITGLSGNVSFDRSIFQKSAEEQQAYFEKRRQETETGVKGILDEEQFARIQQLTLRASGISAVGQSDVQAELNFTDAQQGTLGKLLTEQRAARRELGRGASSEDRQKFSEEWNAKISAILTDEQNEAWEKLLGPPPAKTEATAAIEE